MKTITLSVVVILLAVFMTVNADDNAEMAAKLKKIFEGVVAACKDKITPENFIKMIQNPAAMSSNSELNCFKACAATHLELMKDGKLQVEKFEEHINSFLGDDKKETAKSMIDATKSCVEEANQNENECDVAGKFEECMKKFNMPQL
ncbi:GSCOCT00000900001.3-RA-CDS [Cotesia congregata]|uniref:Odorant binding protein 3.0900 n=1 Tax=Cotesia congregata TaxID=51543 RepID=A0A8J2HFW1_COTCN|nr:GSCOCT00000900001.3-RA-CDS [Cotesia congregata]CAG5095732.1 Odorant binding protein 3.0900 [Cotesia congregata]